MEGEVRTKKRKKISSWLQPQHRLAHMRVKRLKRWRWWPPQRCTEIYVVNDASYWEISMLVL
ncbi:MAG: hypothetical protein ACKESB_01150 [Candidatus Hodgkinia cicadicola]